MSAIPAGMPPIAHAELLALVPDFAVLSFDTALRRDAFAGRDARGQLVIALADPAAPESARTWADYATSWTMWNHVRTVAPLLGSAFLLTGIRSR